MSKFGFGPEIITWINLLTYETTSCVIQHGKLSNFFTNERGCRQGDPLSPYLFIFVAEILGIMIRNNKDIKGIVIDNNEYKLNQYADDTELFLDGSEKSLKAAIDEINTFYDMSGLKININKTKAIWIGSMIHCKDTLCKDLKIEWVSGNFSVLGIIFNTQLDDLWVINTRKRLEDINRLLAQWKKRHLTLIGKITVIKTLAISKLVHIFNTLPNPPKDFTISLERIFFKFIWNGKPDKIKRKNMKKLYKDGRLTSSLLDSFQKGKKFSKNREFCS